MSSKAIIWNSILSIIFVYALAIGNPSYAGESDDLKFESTSLPSLLLLEGALIEELIDFKDGVAVNGDVICQQGGGQSYRRC
jgi:hypothetical protein